MKSCDLPCLDGPMALPGAWHLVEGVLGRGSSSPSSARSQVAMWLSCGHTAGRPSRGLCHFTSEVWAFLHL